MNDFELRDDMVGDELPMLSLDVSDKYLANHINRLVSESEKFWNDKTGFNLEFNRKRNMDYYLGNQIDKSRLYSHQVPYVDNQIIVGVEAIMAYATSRVPYAEVYPSAKDSVSRVMASNLEKAINSHNEKWNISKKFESASRNMYLNRLGVVKLSYDPYLKDIVPSVVEPMNLVIDHLAKEGEEPRFIAEYVETTIGELIEKFDNSEEKILRHFGRVRKSDKFLGTSVVYQEVWFSYLKDGEKLEGVCWKLGEEILDKKKNPNYLYDEEGLQIKNYSDVPQKPYIAFNYLNDGSHWIDYTTPVEQAIPLQDVLNKRGRQIIENADTANAILVLKSGAVTDGEAENITRNPNEVLVLDVDNGMPLSSAYGEIEPHLLPSYVLSDKESAKAGIHSILGTPSQFRGDDSNREVGTLGEAQMMKSQASGRQDAVVRAIENGANRYFKMLAQMMKVYYDESEQFVQKGVDGDFFFIELSRESMPDNAWVVIREGSMIREDRNRKENIAMTLAKMGLIDPYNLFKDLNIDSADKRYEALVKFKMGPDSLVEDVKSDIGDETAYVDFAVCMNGVLAKAREDVTPEHLRAHQEQLNLDKFLYADNDKKALFLRHIEMEKAKLEIMVNQNPQEMGMNPEMNQEMMMNQGMSPEMMNQGQMGGNPIPNVEGMRPEMPIMDMGQ